VSLGTEPLSLAVFVILSSQAYWGHKVDLSVSRDHLIEVAISYSCFIATPVSPAVVEIMRPKHHDFDFSLSCEGHVMLSVT